MKGFVKDGNKNRLRAQDIHKIVDVFTRQIELPRYSRMVPLAEIADPANDYNLNIPRYIDSSEPEDLHDLDAHLNGGIPDRDIDALEALLDRVSHAAQGALSRERSRGLPGGSRRRRTGSRRPSSATPSSRRSPSGWPRYSRPGAQPTSRHSKAIKVNDLPRELIHTLSEDLLARFADLPLLSRYDVYQRLMDYWSDVMQDDVYLIAADGWLEAAKPRGIVEDKEQEDQRDA